MARMKNTADPDGLSVRERAFVDAFLGGMKTADAYIAAGYKPSTRTKARSSASSLSRRPHVKAAIAKARHAATARAQIGRDEIVGFLTDVIRTAIGKIDENSPLAQEFTRTEGEISSSYRLKMVDKMAAIKHLTLLLNLEPTKKIEVEASDPLKSLLLRLRSS
jgi:phage terminase small subunit